MHDLDRTLFEIGETELGSELGEVAGEGSFGELNEVNELELATELLEITSEQELEQFLGALISRAGQAVGQFARSDTGRALGGILKNAARKALPVVGRAAGNWIAPGVGGDVGARLAAGAGRLFGLELEGLSNEDREFEVARRFVRFADEAARRVSVAPPNVPPRVAAVNAAAAAARAHAPGFLPALTGGPTRRRGRWVRRGRTIVLLGA